MLSGATLGTVATLSGTNQAVMGGLAMDAQGDLYGTTTSGGEGGITKGDATVFEIPVGGTKPVTLASFDNAKGYGISSVTLDAQGNLYATLTGEGGSQRRRLGLRDRQGGEVGHHPGLVQRSKRGVPRRSGG